jgi:hypothetical protein
MEIWLESSYWKDLKGRKDSVVMPRENRRLFEIDRRMELRLRLAAKKLGSRHPRGSQAIVVVDPPKREMVDRLIERVRKL